MPKTLLVTGASSGIGKATVRLFHDRGWQVVATLRDPSSAPDLTALEGVLVTRLDVTDPDSITAAVGAAQDRFGGIDALVNNAGYGAYGPVEAFPAERVRRLFDTNVLGQIAVTQAVLPLMRAQGSGVVAMVSSLGGRVAMPLGAPYHATKFAIEGLCESLMYELAPLGIRVKLIEPGATDTGFGKALDIQNDPALEAYQPTVGAVIGAIQTLFAERAPAETVAEVLWTAITDDSNRLRYPAAGAETLLDQRATQDDATLFQTIRTMHGL